MKTKYLLLSGCTFLLAFLVFTCNRPQPLNDEAEKAAIQKIIDMHLEGVDKLDINLIAPHLAEDHLEMPANMDRISGVKPYLEYCQGFFDYAKNLKKHEMICKANETVVSGNWAFQIGTYTFRTVDSNDSVQEDKGNYVWIFKKDSANNWKWARVISNSTLPMK